MPDAQAAAERRSRLYWLLLVVVLIVVDQLSKYLADSQLVYGQPNALLPVLDITLHYNPGAAFSFLSDAGGWQRWFFTAIAVLVSGYLLVWLMRLTPSQRLLSAALSLVLSGAIGNLVDRLLHGHVIDFISVHWGSAYFPTFNIADSAITVGAILLVLDTVISPESRN